MPIRFRCPHCAQLMGIARRKAGTNVPCPRCAKGVVVPADDEYDAPPAPRVPAPPSEVPLLDRPDFDEEVERHDRPVPVPRDGALSVLGARRPPTPGEAVEYDVEPVDPKRVSPAGGFVLTSAQATLLILAAILAMVLAFGAGLLVGKFFL